jgi:hypothetical protein
MGLVAVYLGSSRSSRRPGRNRRAGTVPAAGAVLQGPSAVYCTAAVAWVPGLLPLLVLVEATVEAIARSW